MKNTVKITSRFVSLFLVFVASSIIFLASPAIAATSSWITLNPDSNPSDLAELQASNNKPTILLFVPSELENIKELKDEELTKMMEKQLLGNIKPEAEKFFGDKYKYVTIPKEINQDFYNKSKNRFDIDYDPVPLIAAIKNGEILRGYSVKPGFFRREFEILESQLKSLDEED